MKKSAAFRMFSSLALMIGGVLGGAGSLLAAPTIFHSSESAGPGEVISIQGDSFSTGAHVGFHRVLATDGSPTPDAAFLTPLYNTDKAITVQLPKNMPMGLYAIWVKDAGSNLSQPAYINRARATGFEYGEISPGYLFRIFGRNLCLPGATPSVSFVTSSNTLAAVVVTSTNIVTTSNNDSNVLRVQAPAGLVAGTTYSIKVSNGYGHNSGLSVPNDVTTCEQTILGRSGGADPFGLNVPWAPDFGNIAADVIDITSTTNPHTSLPYGYGLTTGATGSNWVNAIQQALYDAGNPALHPNGATVYLPAATYLLDQAGESTTFIGIAGKSITQPAYTELVMPSNVVIKGAGTTSTTIDDATAPMPYPDRAIVNNSTSPTLCGLINLTYQQTCTVTTVGSPQIVLAGNKACFSNLNLLFAHNAPPNATGGYFGVANSTSHDVIVQNVTLDYGGFAAQTGSGASYIIMRNNSFSHHGNYKRTRMLMGGIQNVLFEGNICSRDSQWPGPHDVDNAYEQGQLECDGASYATILNNTFFAVAPPLDSNFGSGETINSQGEPAPGTDTGTVTSSTTNSLSDSTRSWPVNILAGQNVSITSGTGKGQTALVLSNTATTLTVTTSWTTALDGTSKYSVGVNSYDMGTVSAATSTTLTGASLNATGTYWPTVGHGLAGQIVAIISGTGEGQWRTIAGNTNSTLTVTQAWNVTPSTDSRYSITGSMADHYLIKGNSFADQPRGVVLYTGSHDCTVVGNTLENTGMTIYLRSDQRNLLSVAGVGNVWYGRMNLSWDDQVFDNVTINNAGAYWPSMIGTAPYLGNSTSFGVLVVGADFRRNVLISDWPNEVDQSSLKEGYSSLGYTHVFSASDVLPVLGTIFEDNASVNTNSSNTLYPMYLNCDSNLTAIRNQLNSGYFTLTPKPYAENYPVESTTPSIGTTYALDPVCLQADFTGTGTNTGGATDLITTGAAGTLAAGSGVDSCAIVASTQFDPGTSSGSYLECTIGPGTGTAGHIAMNPTNTRTSWGRIFDFRTGQWLVNGGFDFFWRPTKPVTTSNAMRPIDINNGTNGLRFVFDNSGGGLAFQVITATGGGGVNLISTAQTFTTNAIYHIGITFSTNPTTGVTTEKMFLLAGTGAINTASSTNLVGTTTFTLSPTAVTNTSGFLGTGSWNFGDAYGNGVLNVNDYDCFRMYCQDPGSFSGL